MPQISPPGDGGRRRGPSGESKLGAKMAILGKNGRKMGNFGGLKWEIWGKKGKIWGKFGVKKGKMGKYWGKFGVKKGKFGENLGLKMEHFWFKMGNLG